MISEAIESKDPSLGRGGGEFGREGGFRTEEDEWSRLSFFFCIFLILCFSLWDFRGVEMKFSKPGGIEGPEMEDDDE